MYHFKLRRPNRTTRSFNLIWQRARLLLGILPLLFSCTAPAAPPAGSPPPPTGTQSPVTVTALADPHPSGTPFNPQPTATLTPPPTPTLIPSPTPTSLIPRPPKSARTQYLFEVVFDYGNHFLEVSQKIRYPNLTGEALSELILIVDPDTFPGIFTLNSLSTLSDFNLSSYSLENAQLVIALEEPLLPEREIALELTYTLDLPLRPSALGYTTRETLLLDWYPFFPPYQSGQGWLDNPSWPHGEYLTYDLADYLVNIQVVNAPDELVIAAGAPASEIAGRLEFTLPAARSFAWSASPEYVKNTVVEGEVTIVSHNFQEHAATGQAVLETAAKALALYSELFSGYPRPYFAVVEAEFADGLEYDGLIFVSRNYHAEYSGTPRDFLILLVAHEVAHQWWYGLVGNDQAGEPWLDEALATYSEFLYYERYHPDLTGWWWQFRVNYFNPEGWVNWSLYDTGRFAVYFHAVYLRGALFLRDLRSLIGDENFFTFLKTYNRDFAYRHATGADFLGYLNEFSSDEIGPLLAAYFKPESLE